MSEGESERAIDRLITIEWDIIHDLQRQLDSDVSQADMVKISNSLAYHVNTLSKLLAERGEEPAVGRESLVEVIARFRRRFRRAVVGRVRRWIRRRSSNG